MNQSFAFPETSIFVSIVLAIIALFLVFKFAKNIAKLVLLAIVIISLGGYLYFGTNLFTEKRQELAQKFTIENVKEQYCTGNISDNDRIKCECILVPLFDDLNKRFSESELAELEKNKPKLITEIFKSFHFKKDEINRLLENKDAVSVLEEFKKEIKSGEFFRRISKS